MLIKYVRDEKRNPYGCVIAFDRNNLSWSLCSKDDKFSKEKAKEVAIKRFQDSKKVGSLRFDYWLEWFFSMRDAYKGKHPNRNLESVLVELNLMQERADRYFKEDGND